MIRWHGATLPARPPTAFDLGRARLAGLPFPLGSASDASEPTSAPPRKPASYRLPNLSPWRLSRRPPLTPWTAISTLLPSGDGDRRPRRGQSSDGECRAKQDAASEIDTACIASPRACRHGIGCLRPVPPDTSRRLLAAARLDRPAFGDRGCAHE